MSIIVIEVRHGRKAKIRQPHKLLVLVVQGELTRFAIYNQ
jgi:hypothetical protein